MVVGRRSLWWTRASKSANANTRTGCRDETELELDRDRKKEEGRKVGGKETRKRKKRECGEV
jgi:hypothetical protein